MEYYLRIAYLRRHLLELGLILLLKLNCLLSARKYLWKCRIQTLRRLKPIYYYYLLISLSLSIQYALTFILFTSF